MSLIDRGKSILQSEAEMQEAAKAANLQFNTEAYKTALLQQAGPKFGMLDGIGAPQLLAQIHSEHIMRVRKLGVNFKGLIPEDTQKVYKRTLLSADFSKTVGEEVEKINYTYWTSLGDDSDLTDLHWHYPYYVAEQVEKELKNARVSGIKIITASYAIFLPTETHYTYTRQDKYFSGDSIGVNIQESASSKLIHFYTSNKPYQSRSFEEVYPYKGLSVGEESDLEKLKKEGYLRTVNMNDPDIAEKMTNALGVIYAKVFL